MNYDTIHITAGVGGELEMVRRIESVFQKENIQSKIICIKPNKTYESIELKTFFDEEWVTFSKLKKLKKLTQNTEIIFYHYISNFSALLILFYLKFFCKKKITGIFHSNLDGPGLFLKKILYLIRKWIVFHFTLWVADYIVFVSKSQKKSFKRLSLFKKTMKKKIKIFYNFISDEIILKKVSKSFDFLNLIFVGRFSFFKGFKDYLKVSNKVVLKNPNINFYAVGQGKYYKKNLFPKTNFFPIGQIPSNTIYQYYDQCNIFFFPSYTESFGLVVLEAMSRGLVILASDIPALREIVIEKQNGFFFPPGNISKMNELIDYCFTHPDEMQRISQNNINDVKKFSEQKNGKRYTELYLSIKKELDDKKIFKIGFDAFPLSVQNNTGIGYYVLNLLKGISKVDKKNQYFLYTPNVLHKERAEIIEQNTNFKIKKVQGWFQNFRRLWIQSGPLLKQIKKDKIDLFISGSDFIPLFLSSKINTGIIIHDLVFKFYPEIFPIKDQLFFKSLFKFCLKKTKNIFTISKDAENDIKKYYHIKDKQVFVIPSGIEIDHYIPKEPLKKTNTILFVGTNQPRKNLIGVLKAFALIADKTDENLIIVGAAGWKNTHIFEFMKTLPLPIHQRIDFKGYIQNHDLIRLYQEAKLFTAPSFHEGFGLIILEAMAAGSPVLTSPRGAIPEYFKDAVVFCDPERHEDIAEKMLSILQNEEVQKDLVLHGNRLVQNFTLENMARGYVEAFEKLKNP